MIATRFHDAGSQQGFTLIETLIAFAILSVGVLGIVSLLAISKTSQHLAIAHSRAVTISDAIVERIRSNPAGLAEYAIGTEAPVGGESIAEAPVPDCRLTDCTPSEMALHDLWVWEQALDGAMATAGVMNTAGLSDPQGCIVFTAAPGYARTGLLSVFIQWRGLVESEDAIQVGEAKCGGADPGEDNYRRQVVTNTYIVDETEL